jgi:hypothetical protein
MKSRSWKKEYVVASFDDYDNTWQVRTIPCTLLQAVRFAKAKGWLHAIDKGTVKLVTLAELESLGVA